MAPEPRSERARARDSLGLNRARPDGRASRAWRRAAALVLAASALGAGCRQSVLLDTPTGDDGGAGGSAGFGSIFDAGLGTGPDRFGGGGMNGGHFDAGHVDGLPFCQFQGIPATPRSPLVIMSVDRSSDMQSWFGTGTRLDVIQQQVQALVMKYRVVKFGYQEFPSPATCASQGCCAGDVVLPNPNPLRAIRQVIHACDGGGPGCNQPQRPIGDALAKCFDAYKNIYSIDDPGHRYVLLFTSGDPTCTSDPTSMQTPCGDAAAKVTKLANTNTNTGVFMVGDAAAASQCLPMVAMYGGIESHTVKTPNDLSSALDTVVETIAEEACKIDLRAAPTDPKSVMLLFDGAPVPMDSLNGWTWDPDTTVVLTVNGTFCRQLVQNTPRVDLVMGCGPHN
jgi:hypothetical protein